jgi:hypothetical protein
MTTNTWPLPWRIAAALARESGLDWGAWAHDAMRTWSDEEWFRTKRHEPVPDPSDAEAYRADCARRGVEPGPMPALSGVGDDVFWSVFPNASGVLFSRGIRLNLSTGMIETPQGAFQTWEWSVVSRLATAAARAMGVGT